MPIVLIGLALAINTTYNIAYKLFDDQRMAFRATAVMSILHTGMGLFFAWVIIG
jgi:ABC-type nickel/cobalt efflux system permease component RcnA